MVGLSANLTFVVVVVAAAYGLKERHLNRPIPQSEVFDS